MVDDSIEIWKPVVGYDGVYEVSSHGRIKRVKKANGTTVGKILKPQIQTTGYLAVMLRDSGRCLRISIHILVAEAFIGPRPERHYVNHIDADKTNPNLSNLEYVTPQQNQSHAAALGNRHYKLTPERVKRLRARYKEVGVVGQVAKEFGIDSSYCGKVIRGRYWPFTSSA